MNSYELGFIKRAQEYGLSEGQALDLLKLDERAKKNMLALGKPSKFTRYLSPFTPAGVGTPMTRQEYINFPKDLSHPDYLFNRYGGKIPNAQVLQYFKDIDPRLKNQIIAPLKTGPSLEIVDAPSQAISPAFSVKKFPHGSYSPDVLSRWLAGDYGTRMPISGPLTRMTAEPLDVGVQAAEKYLENKKYMPTPAAMQIAKGLGTGMVAGPVADAVMNKVLPSSPEGSSYLEDVARNFRDTTQSMAGGALAGGAVSGGPGAIPGAIGGGISDIVHKGWKAAPEAAEVASRVPSMLKAYQASGQIPGIDY